MDERAKRQRPELSRLEADIWRDFIERRAGLDFVESRLRFLSRCLWQRMEVRGIRTYSEYYHHVAYNRAGEGEWKELVELVVNRETGFFRHLPSFDAVERRVLPELLARREEQGIRAVTAWSAGCSDGREAYSLAMVLREAADPGRWAMKVCGTDLSETALAEARRGSYRASRLRTLPERYRRYLEPAGAGEETHRVVGEIRSLVELGRLDLSQPGTWWVGAQDVVFCQNVLIYFRPERRLDVVSELCRRLKPGGYLFLAPGEVVGLKLPGIRSIHFENALAYRKEA